MSKTEDFSHYPLPEVLTRRVVSYLNMFRLLVSTALLYALYAGLVSITNNLVSTFAAYGVLITYLFVAMVLFTFPSGNFLSEYIQAADQHGFIVCAVCRLSINL